MRAPALVVRLLSWSMPPDQRERFVEEWAAVLQTASSPWVAAGYCAAAARVARVRTEAALRRPGVVARSAGLLLQGLVVGVLLAATDVPPWLPVVLVLIAWVPVGGARLALHLVRA